MYKHSIPTATFDKSVHGRVNTNDVVDVVVVVVVVVVEHKECRRPFDSYVIRLY